MADDLHLKPTFPLDAREIRQRQRQSIVTSPLNWLGLAGAGIFAVATGTGLGGLLVGCAIAGGGLFAYWRSRMGGLESEAVQWLVQQSNIRQDNSIRGAIRNLHERGYRQYAISLGKFLLLKQHIETELHRDEDLTPRKEQLEELTDSICNGVMDQIKTLTHMDDRLADTLTSNDDERLDQLTSDQTSHHKQIMQAYSTLCETAQRLEVVMKPTATHTEADETRTLDRLIEQLREETEIATRVNERMRELE